MHRLRLAVVVALGSLAALACLAPAAGAQTRAGTTRLVAQALSGLGGRSAVTGLRKACGGSYFSNRISPRFSRT